MKIILQFFANNLWMKMWNWIRLKYLFFLIWLIVQDGITNPWINIWYKNSWIFGRWTEFQSRNDPSNPFTGSRRTAFGVRARVFRVPRLAPQHRIASSIPTSLYHPLTPPLPAPTHYWFSLPPCRHHRANPGQPFAAVPAISLWCTQLLLIDARTLPLFFKIFWSNLMKCHGTF